MEMQVRDRIPALTTILTLVSLALVVGAVRGYVPTAVLPRAPTSSSTRFRRSTPRSARSPSSSSCRDFARSSGERRPPPAPDAHRIRPLPGLPGALPLSRLAGRPHALRRAGVGREVPLPPDSRRPYGPPQSSACPAVLRSPARLQPSRRRTPATNHPRVGRVAAVLWLVSFALGIVVYLPLYVVY